MDPHADRLARYQHLRRVGLALNHRLVKTLPKDVLDEGGKKLGILKKNTLVLDSEDEIVVLMDYCIYDVRRQGINAVERYLAESPPPPGSDEMVILQAMRLAKYSLCLVEAVERGIGAHVRDLLRDERFLLMDFNFSQTVPVGAILAGRVMAPDGIWMTTGAALPFGGPPQTDTSRFLEDLVKQFKALNVGQMSPEKASAISAELIRSCLQSGAAGHIEYRDPDSLGSGRRPQRPGPLAAAPPAARRIGRNEPCPCGSGKKFKHCCGGRR